MAIVIVAELGDKTQLATLLFSADKPASKWTVFAGSAAALVLAAGIGVLAGTWLSQHVSPRHLKLVAGGLVSIDPMGDDVLVTTSEGGIRYQPLRLGTAVAPGASTAVMYEAFSCTRGRLCTPPGHMVVVTAMSGR
mgnify:CR=1 FL=1